MTNASPMTAKTIRNGRASWKATAFGRQDGGLSRENNREKPGKVFLLFPQCLVVVLAELLRKL